jgi:hypothetical protein
MYLGQKSGLIDGADNFFTDEFNTVFGNAFFEQNRAADVFLARIWDAERVQLSQPTSACRPSDQYPGNEPLMVKICRIHGARKIPRKNHADVGRTRHGIHSQKTSDIEESAYQKYKDGNGEGTQCQ